MHLTGIKSETLHLIAKGRHQKVKRENFQEDFGPVMKDGDETLD